MTDTPTLYKKGEQTRFAYTPADVVKMKFEGFVPASDVAEDASYAELREQAKALGVPVKGNREILAKAVIAAQEAAASQTTVDEAIADAESQSGEPSALDQVTTDTEATA
jgi:hypothetical protein